MQAHQERVVEEQKELADKCDKLKTFILGDIFNTVHIEEQLRLSRQLKAMLEYDRVLKERIEKF